MKKALAHQSSSRGLRLLLVSTGDALKRHLLKVFLLDAFFLVFLFSFLAWVRMQLEQYIFLFQQLAPQLALLRDSGTPENLEAVVGIVDPIIQKATVLLMVVLPVGAFLLYVLFQGAGWNLLKRRHSLDGKALLLFGLVSLPAYVLFLLLARTFLARVNLSLEGYALNLSQVFSPLIVAGLGLLVVGSYFTLAVYGAQGVGAGMRLSLRRAGALLPLFLLLYR